MSDRIVSHPSTAAYRENWERIWGKPQSKPVFDDDFQEPTSEEMASHWEKMLHPRTPEETEKLRDSVMVVSAFVGRDGKCKCCACYAVFMEDEALNHHCK